MEGYEDVRFKQHATIEFLTAGKFHPSTFITMCKCMGINVSCRHGQMIDMAVSARYDMEGNDGYRQVS